MAIPFGAYCFYLFQTGFYIYNIIALLCVEVVQKDFTILLLHHILGYCLLISSYAIRYIANSLYFVFT